MKLNNKGIVEASATFMYAVVMSALVIAQQYGAPILFSGGSTVGSAYFAAANVLTVYSQLPHVKHDFRVKKAKTLCEQGYRGTSCEAVSAMSDDEILSYIKDDIEVPQYQMMERLGG